jgi:hypothetical protein
MAENNQKLRYTLTVRDKYNAYLLIKRNIYDLLKSGMVIAC